MIFSEALAQIAKNITVKLSADGVAGSCAILGGTLTLSCLAGYGLHEYFEYKKRMAELNQQLEFARLKNEKNNLDDDNDSDDGPTPLDA